MPGRSHSTDAQQLHSEPRYRQLARILADAIAEGEEGDYPPGSQLPSETELLERYAVSRNTVRQAVAELRRMGLAVSQQGKGTYVRQEPEQTHAIKRTLIRKGKRLELGHPGFAKAETVTVTRGHARGIIARLIGRGAIHTLTAERLIIDEDTGVRAAALSVIPFDIADEVPALAERPDAHPEELYAMLTAAGHTLSFWENVTARSARPDEQAALGMADTILITHRVTEDQNGRALLVEELRMSAESASLSYRITPTTPKRG
ncbi:GntR family transcriptional regulator [Streptomyces sp. 5-10]|uniref:GntR family transcriptional regulator n=1 Tax=Streptomyces sp. 5-10 TaxID=878925 RepID=UPI00168B04B8|nr:GntR family transcriptional regulator [Streptomyces sp. 5-10]MBD3005706.1 GntR family transcriptional regulator [Streptomyces sp. 5-10]